MLMNSLTVKHLLPIVWIMLLLHYCFRHMLYLCYCRTPLGTWLCKIYVSESLTIRKKKCMLSLLVSGKFWLWFYASIVLKLQCWWTHWLCSSFFLLYGSCCCYIVGLARQGHAALTILTSIVFVWKSNHYSLSLSLFPFFFSFFLEIIYNMLGNQHFIKTFSIHNRTYLWTDL